jgi:hypothetical protein
MHTLPLVAAGDWFSFSASQTTLVSIGYFCPPFMTVEQAHASSFHHQ